MRGLNIKFEFPTRKQYCKKIIFVFGARHSGTTLLGMMLGSGNGTFFAGEIQRSKEIYRTTSMPEDQTCFSCDSICPVWNSLPAEMTIYESLAERSGSHTIIDTSKGIRSWIMKATQYMKESDLYLITIVRDPRAVVAENFKKQPHSDIAANTQRWIKSVNEYKRYSQTFPGKAITIRYEELTTQPETTLRKVCKSIELPFEKKMLDPWSTIHHPLHCSKRTLLKKYQEKNVTIHFDESWKRKLSQDQEKTIIASAGQLFKQYRWG